MNAEREGHFPAGRTRRSFAVLAACLASVLLAGGCGNSKHGQRAVPAPDLLHILGTTVVTGADPAIAVTPAPSAGGGGAFGAPPPQVEPEAEADSAGRVRPSALSPEPSIDPVLDRGGSDPRLAPPDISFEGTDIGDIDPDAAGVPADAVGDIGPSNYIEVTNHRVAVFGRDGTSLRAFTMNTLFGVLGPTGACATYDSGDPVVAYDERAGRFVLSQFAFAVNAHDQPTGSTWSCVAVSRTSNPLDGWCVTSYEYPGKRFYDYPKLGVWGDSYTLTAVSWPSSNTQSALVAMERAPMLDCSRQPRSARVLIDGNFRGPYWLPLDADGPTAPAGPPTFIAVTDDAWPALGGVALHDSLLLAHFVPDYNTGTISQFSMESIATAAFDSSLCRYERACLPEPTVASGTSAKLEALSDRLMNRADYRQSSDHGTLVVAHTVDIDGADHAGVRWYQLERRSDVWSLEQQGTFAPDDGVNRSFPSAALSGHGDVVIAYSVSGPQTAPGGAATARSPDDTPGTMGREVQLQAGVGVLLQLADDPGALASRWGDYSGLTVDPADPCRLWYTIEYQRTDGVGKWDTRVVSFRLLGCGGG